eukprot:TRINITY_DN10718_c0_g1_i1.p1 TRINITY_DN10718_c0_g1~~TRINITY_DN10718_c0_g1_i1.p1  ORF type:complete len:511 (-),score=94.64 TRINITY_DN10718_c0_g1_i1:83-1390(-)
MDIILQSLFNFFIGDNRKEASEAFHRLSVSLSQAERTPHVHSLKSMFVKFIVDIIIEPLCSNNTKNSLTIEEDIKIIHTLSTYFPEEMGKREYRDITMIGDYLCTNKLLGVGQFSRVILGYHKRTGRPVAIKCMNKSSNSSSTQDLMSKEIETLKRLNHQNIVKLYDYHEANGFVYLITEFCSGETLEKYIKDNPNMSEKTAKFIITQIVQGLRYLCEQRIFHRDLKPANVLIHHESLMFRVKLADFTFSRQIDADSLAQTLCGTEEYMAPEVYSKCYTNKSDLWSMGVIIYQMLIGKLPFPQGARGLFGNVTFPKDKFISENAKLLITSLLERDPNQRISWEDFFTHPFIVTCEGEAIEKGVEQARKALAETEMERKKLEEQLKLCSSEKTIEELEKEISELEADNDLEREQIKTKDDIIKGLLEILEENKQEA